MLDLKTVSFADLLAPSIADDPTIRAMVAPLDEEFRQVTAAINSVLLLPRLEEIVDPAIIDLLAYQMHVDFYDPSLSMAVRKSLIRQSIEFHTYKGTTWAVEQMLQTVFESGRVFEWFEYRPKPHADWHDAFRFKIQLRAGTPIQDPVVLPKLIRAINAVKPASRHLDQFVVPVLGETELGHGVAMAQKRLIRIFMGPVVSKGPIFAGLALCVYHQIIIVWEGPIPSNV
jgi:phage tail P2-like protein